MPECREKVNPASAFLASNQLRQSGIGILVSGPLSGTAGLGISPAMLSSALAMYSYIMQEMASLSGLLSRIMVDKQGSTGPLSCFPANVVN